MPGIAGIITEREIEQEIEFSNAFHRENGIAYLEDSERFQKASFGRFSVNKFQNDKIFKKIGRNLICTDGVIFNLKNLLHQYNAKEFDDLIIKLYNKYNWKFVQKLRGNFSGFVYFEKDNKLMVFTDHLAAKPVYYFYDKDSNTLVFASELKVVVNGMRQLGFTPHLDVGGAYCILTFAYMIGDLTLVKEIKKIPPGNVLLYENGEIKLKEYYKLSSIPYIEGDEEEIIKELDRRFTEAIKLEYEKDLEYGYSHIATLSGGLDSRTNVGYAKKRFDKITCFTFSESDYDDEKIAKKICLDKHLEFIFYALDNGYCLVNNTDKIVSANDGLVLYSGSAHLYNCLRNLSFQDYGLVHTGLIGDLVVGSYLQGKKHEEICEAILNKITYSAKLTNKLKNVIDKNNFGYENDELFAFYERCVNGVFNGYRMIEQFTEFSSPFLYIEFLDYVMKIHPRYRYKQYIYLKWINKYITEFSKYKRDGYGLSPKDTLRYPFFITNMYRLFRALMRKILRKRHTSMNPFEYWWNTNKTLQKEINSIFKKNIQILENYSELLEDSNYLFKEGSLLEKTQVITLLKAIKLLGINDKKAI
jgi:asparagine synthase (glutamine-hydrolysing)